MYYSKIVPSPHLSQLVDFFWVLEADVQNGQHYTHRSVAMDASGIIFHYKGHFSEVHNLFPASHILAQSESCRLFTTNQSFGIFGVQFNPLVNTYLFRVSSDELSNSLCDLKSLLGNTGRSLEDEVISAPNTQRRVEIVSRFLKKKFCDMDLKNERIFHAVDHIRNGGYGDSVADMASHVNLSVRQFERRFKQAAGFSPKLFAKIVRFQKAYHQIGVADESIMNLSFDTGYYDHSHLHRDFMRFAGYNPGCFVNKNGANKPEDNEAWWRSLNR